MFYFIVNQTNLRKPCDKTFTAKIGSHCIFKILVKLVQSLFEVVQLSDSVCDVSGLSGSELLLGLKKGSLNH